MAPPGGLRPFISYCIIGLGITAIEFSLLFALKEFLRLNAVLAAGIAYLLANMISFALNRRFTFQSSQPRVFRQYAKYLATALSGMAATVVLMWLTYSQLHLFSTLTRYDYLLCKALVTPLVVVWNFSLNRAWTFSLKQEELVVSCKH